MWTNPDFVDGPAGTDTKRLFYGAYQQWSADTNPRDGNNTGVGMVQMTVDRFAYFTNLNLNYPGTTAALLLLLLLLLALFLCPP